MDHPKDHSLFGLGLPGYIYIYVYMYLSQKKYLHQTGKGKSWTQKCQTVGDILVPRRVPIHWHTKDLPINW